MCGKICFFFALIALPFTSQCFSSTELAAALALPLRGTRFHDTITRTAVCKVQYNWMVQNPYLFGSPLLPFRINSLTAPEPLSYEKCPYVNWEAALLLNFALARVAVQEFEKASFAPDMDPSTSDDPTYHFDSDLKIVETNNRLIEARRAIITGFQDLISNYTALRISIGHSLHTLQDFYSHTNWIEMNNTSPNVHIALDSNLGIPVAPPDMKTCSSCTRELTPEQEQEAIKWEKSITEQAERYLGRNFSASNVYICKDNLLNTGHLTSGFFVSEAAVAPKIADQMKCSHGGGTDATVQIAATGGINKDSKTFLYSPHYYLHFTAADAALQATIDYLEGIRIAINNEKKFGRLLGFLV